MAVFSPEVLPASFRAKYDSWSDTGRAAWQADRLKGQIDHMYLGTAVIGGDFQPVPHGRYDDDGRYVGLFANFVPKDPAQIKPLHALDAPCDACARLLGVSINPGCTVCNGTGRVHYRKRMILWPRGSFKSSAVIVEIVQLILNYPNIRICFMTGNQKLGRRRLKQVKKIFEQPTQKFRALYPEFCGRDLGDQDEFTIPCRTAEFIDQPTFCISSAKTINAGSHFDVIFIDDLVNEQNYKNPEALEKCWQEYCDIGPLLSPNGLMYVTGTRYSFGDTYERIREAAEREMREKGKSTWKIDIRTCWIEKCECTHPDHWHNKDKNHDQPPCLYPGCECKCFKGDGKRQVLFPRFTKPNGDQEGYTEEFLEAEKNEKGEEWFACQYENHPIARGSQAFTTDLITGQTIYDAKKIPPAGVGITFIMGDLAYIGDRSPASKKRDECVFFVFRAVAGQLFVLDCIAGKWDADLVAEKVVLAILTYRPHIFWLERFNGWDAYDSLIRSKAMQVGLQRVPVEWLKMDQTPGAKVIRIGSVKGWLAQKKLWFWAGVPGYDKIITQLLRWPKLGKHDDYADCLGLACNAPHGQALTMIPSSNPEAVDFMHSIRQQAEAMGSVGPPSGPCGSTIVC